LQYIHPTILSNQIISICPIFESHMPKKWPCALCSLDEI
jgi:hypothetical protein